MTPFLPFLLSPPPRCSRFSRDQNISANLEPLKALAFNTLSVRRKRSRQNTAANDQENRWDSSDPDRAPPPLPLNPGRGTPHSSPTKPNTSAHVAAAAQALVERARENLHYSHPRGNGASQNGSPERPSARTPQHRRLQSLQGAGKPRDLSKPPVRENREASPENVSSPRPATPGSAKDYFSVSPDRSLVKSGTPTPTLPNGNEKENSKDGIARNNSTRPPPRPLFGGSSPSSSTMLALRNMKVPDSEPPLADITNEASPPVPPVQQNQDSIYQQMLTLTNIANMLQKEMNQLSRRSKDNATDLISLKEATKSRDEDIRKSLRELIITSRAADVGLLGPHNRDVTRPNSAMGLTHHFLDDMPHDSPPFVKSISLPKIPPPHSLEINADHDRATSPSPYSVEGAASVAMLEKIIREMVTKEGQERLISTLTELMEKSSKDSTETSKQVGELVDFIRDKSNSKALVRQRGRHGSGYTNDSDSSFDGKAVLARMGHRAPSPPRPAQSAQQNVVNDEFLKLLQKIKDSVTQSGGMTGEVKSLIRELRGEVLGMGRELGRKLDDLESSRALGSPNKDSVDRQDIEQIVEEGLADLKDHMDQVIETRRRQSSASALSRNTVDSSEVYDVVKHALAEHGLDQSQALQRQDEFDRESILNAVKEAYEAYKPEIEIHQVGLERDQILECLQEGLEDYRSSNNQPGRAMISRDEVFGAVQDAMQTFQPPAQPTEASEIKEEILHAVRECLENFQPSPIPEERPRSSDGEIRDQVLDAVREALDVFRKEGARELEISPDDLFHAVKSGLENMPSPFGAYGEQVLNSLHEIVEGMRVEFKQYSAANGRDTEQVLDAMKDGMEDLRAEIESYVDRAQDVTGKDEIMATLKLELASLRVTFEDQVMQKEREGDDSSSKSSDIIGYVKAEFEHLHHTIADQSTRDVDSAGQKEELLGAISNGFAELKASSGSRNLDDPVEEQLEALKEEFEQLREAILSGTAAQKDDLMESMQEGLGNLHYRIGDSTATGQSSGEIVHTLREEFAALKDSMAAPVLHSGRNAESQEEIVEAVRDAVNGVRVQLASDQSDAANESLGAIKEELEKFREGLGGSLMLSAPGIDKESVLHTVRSALEELPTSLDRDGSTANSESLENIREELEQLRQSISSSLVQAGGHSDHGNRQDILDVMRNGLDDLKTQISSQVSIPGQSRVAEDSEAFDSVHENLNSLRGDIARMIDKPVDMTVSYEILDTLKDGLSNVRSDIDRLKARDAEVVLAEGAKGEMNRGLSEADLAGLPGKGDFERLEVMLTQLRIKMEAMDENMQSAPFMAGAESQEERSSSVKREHLHGIESTLRELQHSLSGIHAGDKSSVGPAGESAGLKETTDAIETMLQNTKAKIDDQVVPSLELAASRDHLETVEAVVRLTSEAVDGLAGKLDGHASFRTDIEAMALMVHEASSSLNDIKACVSSSDASGADKVAKRDLEAIEATCVEIKDKIDDLPSTEDLPTDEDIGELKELLQELKDGHEGLREKYETDISITAKAFDDRKEEANAIMASIDDLKSFVEETRETLKSKVKRGNEDVRAIDEILQGIEDKIDDAPSAVDDVRELQETVNREFDRMRRALEGLKSDHETKSGSILEKHDQHKIDIISDLTVKMDERFSTVLARHDQAQHLSETAAQNLSSRAAQQDDVLSNTRAMAEELKITIDTLGSLVTGITPALEEATTKMGDDAKTVYNKVEEIYSKLDDTHDEGKAEHQLTRDEVAKSVSLVTGLHEEVAAQFPRFMDALKDMAGVVDKASAENSTNLKSHFDEGLKRMPVPQIEAPESTKFDDSTLHRKLDELLIKSASSADDSQIHDKLDQLLEKGSSASDATPAQQLEKVHEINQQLTQTATEVQAFVAFQTKMLNAEHENKEKEADQAALDLSKCLNEREVVEADITSMKDEKQSLAADVESLKAEKTSLTSQRLHLHAEVSSLETALRLRREELQMMDARADALERRIIEGVMDHSRALLIAKAPRANQAVNMNLKRVGSNNSAATARPDKRPSTPSMVNASVGLALKSQSPRNIQGNSRRTTQNPSERRIVSLSQMSHNLPAGGNKAFTPSSIARDATANKLKRSQSVKSHGMRKTSWNGPTSSGRSNLGSLAGGDEDKENSILSEEDDEHIDHQGGGGDMVRYTGGRVIDDDPPLPSPTTQRTLSTSSRYPATTTGSYFTGSDVTGATTTSGRRSSYGSTIRSDVGGVGTTVPSSIAGADEEYSSGDSEHDAYEDAGASEVGAGDVESVEEELHAHAQGPSAEGRVREDEVHSLPQPSDEIQRHHEGYDSGLGSDLPTANLSAAGLADDYFRAANNEIKEGKYEA